MHSAIKQAFMKKISDAIKNRWKHNIGINIKIFSIFIDGVNSAKLLQFY